MSKEPFSYETLRKTNQISNINITAKPLGDEEQYTNTVTNDYDNSNSSDTVYGMECLFLFKAKH